MSNHIDEQLTQHFSERDLVNLPSNFSWLVMQKVIVERVERARRKAWFEILAVWLLTLVSGGMLVAGLWFYTDLPMWQVEIPRLGIVSAGFFALFLLGDLLVRDRMISQR